MLPAPVGTFSSHTLLIEADAAFPPPFYKPKSESNVEPKSVLLGGGNPVCRHVGIGPRSAARRGPHRGAGGAGKRTRQEAPGE